MRGWGVGGFIAEQVSSNPRVFAYHFDSDTVEITGSVEAKVSISISQGLEILMDRPQKYRLKSTGEEFRVQISRVKIGGLPLSPPSLRLKGVASCEEIGSGIRAEFDFSESGNDRDFEGKVFDHEGKVVMKAKGFFNGEIWASEAQGENPILITAKLSEKSVNAQYKNIRDDSESERGRGVEALRGPLPPTDTRLRPDLLAFKKGNMVLAEKERQRLFDSQTKRLNALEDKGEVYEPIWFKKTSEFTKFEYRGGYWECKAIGNWPDRISPIF